MHDEISGALRLHGLILCCTCPSHLNTNPPTQSTLICNMPFAVHARFSVLQMCRLLFPRSTSNQYLNVLLLPFAFAVAISLCICVFLLLTGRLPVLLSALRHVVIANVVTATASECVSVCVSECASSSDNC